MNPNHDKRGEFTTGKGVAGAAAKAIGKKAAPRKNSAAKDLEDAIAKKNEFVAMHDMGTEKPSGAAFDRAASAIGDNRTPKTRGEAIAQLHVHLEEVGWSEHRYGSVSKQSMQDIEKAKAQVRKFGGGKTNSPVAGAAKYIKSLKK